jgi:alanine racemase
MRYTTQQIAEITGGSFLAVPHEAVIEHLLLDSRQVIFPASSLFIALQGRRHDGHEFLRELYDGGVRNFIVSKPTANSQQLFPSANFIFVKNAHVAFHQLAAWHRHQFDLPVVGITGSNGKTIVKEWLFQLLHEDYHIVRSPKSFNSQTGVPLSVLQITPEHTLGIFEAGISRPGEMAKLAPILDPGIGIFTNIGEAHSEGFPDIETKIREKLILFKNAKTVIYCVDNQLIDDEMKKLPGKIFFTWSATDKPADLQIDSIQQRPSGTTLIPHPSSLIPHPSSLIPELWI